MLTKRSFSNEQERKESYLQMIASMVRGRVVQLKSGGPKMTVEEMEGGSKALCIWFDEKNDLHRKWFDADALEIVGL